MATLTTPRRDAADDGDESTGASRSLDALGISPAGAVHWNHVAPQLVQAAVRRNEGELADMGPFVAITTPHTGRSPNDKFVVRESSSEQHVDWGKVNQPMSE